MATFKGNQLLILSYGLEKGQSISFDFESASNEQGLNENNLATREIPSMLLEIFRDRLPRNDFQFIRNLSVVVT